MKREDKIKFIEEVISGRHQVQNRKGVFELQVTADEFLILSRESDPVTYPRKPEFYSKVKEALQSAAICITPAELTEEEAKGISDGRQAFTLNIS